MVRKVSYTAVHYQHISIIRFVDTSDGYSVHCSKFFFIQLILLYNNNMSNKELIKTENLSFLDMIEYPDIFVNEGQTTFINGKSGSGKSSLLKLFSALVTASGGKIYFDGTDIDEIDAITLRRDLIYVPQDFYLFDGTIRENFTEFYRFRELDVIEDDLIRKYLDICMIDFDIDGDTVSMSGGERQRIFIAICISFLPKVIMLDEPTSALDSTNGYNMLLNIKKFCNENSMNLIVVSHDEKLSTDFAEQIITLKRREIL